MCKILVVGKEDLKEKISLDNCEFSYTPEIKEKTLNESFDIIISDGVFDGIDKFSNIPLLFIIEDPKDIEKIKGEKLNIANIILKDKEGKYLKLIPEIISHTLKNIQLNHMLNHMIKEEKEIIVEWEKLAENSLASIYIYDQDLNFLYVNPSTCEILGYKREELMKMKVPETVYEEDIKKWEELKNKRFSGESESAQFEIRLKTKDGNIKHCLISGRICNFGGKKVIMGTALDITEKHQYNLKIVKTLEETIYAITKIVEMKDPYTAGHQRKVALLSEAIGREVGFSNEKLKEILWAGLLHDIGKIVIPSEILILPRKLTPIEFGIVKTHPVVGYNILKEIEFFKDIAEIVIQHHERLDGTGYPKGLKEDRIRKEARIIAVSDVIEAMSSNRPYRPALVLEEAFEELISNKAKKYDPEIVDICVDLFTKKKFTFD